MLQGSPRLAAQRLSLDRQFGATAQRAAPEEELQMTVSAATSTDAQAVQLVAAVAQLEKLEGTNLDLSKHSKDRMDEYGLSAATVADVVNSGTQYSDSRPEHAGQTIYYKNNIAIAVKGGTITTVMNNARVKNTWTPK